MTEQQLLFILLWRQNHFIFKQRFSNLMHKTVFLFITVTLTFMNIKKVNQYQVSCHQMVNNRSMCIVHCT